MIGLVIFLGIVIILLGAFASWRELQYHRYRPIADSAEITRLQDLLDKERNAHLVEVTKLENYNREVIAVFEQELRDEKHRLELEWAEKKRTDRKVSNARSRSALVAKIAEHMAPMLAGFPYNPKDVRHIGELFDFLVLDGLEDGEIRQVVFLEVKTRASGRVTNPREVMLRDAIEGGRVIYDVYVPKIPRISDDSSS
jgi:predicted Holliday junction resolvase-like endonuclease